MRRPGRTAVRGLAVAAAAVVFVASSLNAEVHAFSAGKIPLKLPLARAATLPDRDIVYYGGKKPQQVWGRGAGVRRAEDGGDGRGGDLRMTSAAAAAAAATSHVVSCNNPVVSGARSTISAGAAQATALLLRGGAVETNVLGGVLAELANIRTPAALLGGAALGIMFISPKPGGNPRLHLLYTALATWAFSLQLVCVLCSTLTYTSAASRGVAMSTSAVAYLSQNMQFEFYVIRASFIYGLFSFLGALTVRGWMTFPERGQRGSATVMTAILAGSTLFLLNFLHYTHNVLTLCLGGMTKKLFWLTMTNMYSSRKRLVRHCVWLLCTLVGIKVLKLGPNQGDEKIEVPKVK